MIPFLSGALLTALVLGYPLSRLWLRAQAAEAEADRADADAQQAATALAEAQQAHADQETLLTVAAAEVERYQTALRGELTRQARQTLLTDFADRASGEVVAFERPRR